MMFDTSNEIHCECIKFCFYPVLKRELDIAMTTWNNHRIRLSPASNLITRPAGRPNVLYFTPSQSDASIQDYKFIMDQNDFDIVEETCTKDFSRDFICSKEFFELSHILMLENALSSPTNPTEALELYNNLVNFISHI